MVDENKENNEDFDEELDNSQDDSLENEKINQSKTKEEGDGKIKEKKDKLSKCQETIDKLEEEKSEIVSHLQRLQADFENSKKQVEKEKISIVKFANEQLILNILESYEDLERAINQSKTKKELREGVELIYSKLKSTLEKEGLKEIPTKGEVFDPLKHEALMTAQSDDHENGEIIDELMKGYMLKDKIIKYPKVRVCKK
jgi:molecular chaperone GrpE